MYTCRRNTHGQFTHTIHSHIHTQRQFKVFINLMFMFLNRWWKLENLEKPARHTENLKRPWVRAEPRTFRAPISHSINVKAFPTALFLVISTVCHRRREDCDLQCMTVFISVLPITLTYFRAHVKCHLWMTPWANKAKGGHHTHTHPQLNVLSLDPRSSFLLYYFSTMSIYTKFNRWTWMNHLNICMSAIVNMRDSSFFQQQDNMWII